VGACLPPRRGRFVGAEALLSAASAFFAARVARRLASEAAFFASFSVCCCSSSRRIFVMSVKSKEQIAHNVPGRSP
jgi:hypothetical protein